MGDFALGMLVKGNFYLSCCQSDFKNCFSGM